MDIDWVVAIGVFLVFTAWAFVYYGQLFKGGEESVAEALELVSDKVVDNLSVNVHFIPLKVNISNGSLSNKVLTFEYRWPFGRNSTKILRDGISQSCNITGNNIYWQSNLAAFANYFKMKYSEQEANLSCTGGFTVVNESPVIPFAVEEGKQVSRARISQMNATNYSVFKASLGINRDFNITITNVSATVVSYGLPPPRGRDVFSKRVFSRIEETEENVTIRFLTW